MKHIEKNNWLVDKMFAFFVSFSHLCSTTNKNSVSDDSEFSNKQKHVFTYLQASKHSQR